MSTGEGARPVPPYGDKAAGPRAPACKPTRPQHSASPASFLWCHGGQHSHQQRLPVTMEMLNGRV